MKCWFAYRQTTFYKGKDFYKGFSIFHFTDMTARPCVEILCAFRASQVQHQYRVLSEVTDEMFLSLLRKFFADVTAVSDAVHLFRFDE